MSKYVYHVAPRRIIAPLRMPALSPSTTMQMLFRVRQKSGEAVVRRNSCPKECFWRVRFLSAPLRFTLKTPENLKGQRRNGPSKRPFWTTVSPHVGFSAPLAHPHYCRSSIFEPLLFGCMPRPHKRFEKSLRSG